MKSSCNIVKDLLPLVLEGIASPDSTGLVEAHVKECEGCRREMAALRDSIVLPMETDTGGLAKLDHQIRRRRTGAAVLAILVTAAVLFGCFLYLYSPVYLPMCKAIAGVTHADGVVSIEFTMEADYFRGEDMVDPETGRKSVTLIAAKHRGDALLAELRGPVSMTALPQGSGRVLRLSEDMDIWYASTASDQEDVLLWGDKIDGGRISLPRLVLGYYFVLALGLGAALLVPALILRRKRAGRVLGGAALVCFSFAASDLMATGGNWRIYDGFDVPVLLGLILVQTALLSAAVLQGIRVYRMNKTDDRA